MLIYLIGSLRNPRVPEIGQELRRYGLEVFDDWYSAGSEADDALRDHQRYKGKAYHEVLYSHAALHVFHFDKEHLDRADAAVLVMPAGKSGHLELGYMIGTGRPGYILMDQEPERVEIMHNFSTGVYFTVPSLVEAMEGVQLSLWKLYSPLSTGS